MKLFAGRLAETPRLVVVALLLATLAVLADALRISGDAHDSLLRSGNDNIMRLVSVRAWLAGQGWFDMTIPSVLPPEGLDLHWSRYVDLAIGAIIWPVSTILPMERAEAVAILLWPSLLQLAFVVLTAHAALRLFGAVPAALAVLAAVLWQVTGSNYLGAPQLDHHGLQILLLGVVIFSLVLPGPAARNGAAGGAAAALSLAIGLESLLPIAIAGLVLYLRMVFGAQGAAGRQLPGFSLWMAGLSLPLYLGQTAPSEWGGMRCDVLGPPVLGLTLTAALVSLAAAAILPRLGSTAVRAAAAALFAALAAGVAVALFRDCLGGPYGALSEDLRDLISGTIIEARPAHYFAAVDAPIFYTHVLPALTAVLIATGLRLLPAGTGPGPDRRAVGVLLIFAWIGVAASFLQIRLLIMAAPVLPALMGYALGALIALRKRRRGGLASAGSGGAVLLAGTLMLFPDYIYYAKARFAAAKEDVSAEAGGTLPTVCQNAPVLGSLGSLPAGRVLAPSALGPAILLVSPHAIVAAPYHRNAAALANAFLPFIADEAGLRRALHQTQADYLVLCRDAVYGDGRSFATRLASGETAPGLIPAAGIDPALVVLRIAAP